MQKYILRRLLLLLLSVIGVSILTFGFIRFLPGDAVELMASEQGYVSMDAEGMAILRKRLGLDRPIHEQYVVWMSQIVRGDFGESFHSRQPILKEISVRIPATIELALMATFFSVIIGISIGILSAIRQDAWVDYILRFLSISLLAIPGFWLATVVILLMSLYLRMAPVVGYVSIFENPVKNLSIFWLPALLMGAQSAGSLMRMSRTTMLEVLRQDYIRTAFAKGLTERKVIGRHALRNALIPVMTMVGIQLGYLLGGAVIFETIFAIPGIGSLMFESIMIRDYPVVQAINLLFAVALLVINLVVDLTYAVVDPRVHYQ